MNSNEIVHPFHAAVAARIFNMRAMQSADISPPTDDIKSVVLVEASNVLSSSAMRYINERCGNEGSIFAQVLGEKK